MANVGALIPTPNGLGTVVQVLPGHIDPALSQVVTLPIGGDGSDVFPPEFGTPLPGQARSAASFVQTLILPSDGGSTDTSGATPAAPAPQAAPTAGTSSSTWSTTDSSTASSQSTNQNNGGNGNSAIDTPASPPSPAFAQAASAYQLVQQRGGGETTQHPPVIG